MQFMMPSAVTIAGTREDAFMPSASSVPSHSANAWAKKFKATTAYSAPYVTIAVLHAPEPMKPLASMLSS